MNRYRTLIFATVLCCSLGTPSFAQESPPSEARAIVVATLSGCCPEEAWPEAEDAIRAELELIDIPVKMVPALEREGGERQAELERIAVREKAAAAIRIVRPRPEEWGSEAGVDLWISDRVVGKTTYRRITISDATAADAVTVVGVRTVDALQASLLELRMARDEDPAVTPSPAIGDLVTEIEIEGAEPERNIAIGLGAGALFSAGEPGALGGFYLGAGWHPLPFGAILIDFVYAPFSSEITGEGSTTSWDLLIFRGLLRWSILQGKRVTPFVAAGGGGAVVFASGEVDDTTRVGYVGGRVGLDVDVGERFRLNAAFDVGGLLPAVELFHSEERVATLGRPLMEARLGLEVRLP